MTNATLEAPVAPASIAEIKRSITELRQQSDDAYLDAVRTAAKTGETPAGWEQIISAASRTRDAFLTDVEREAKRQQAASLFAQADDIVAEVVSLDEKYAELASERDRAEAEQNQKHQAALERIRKPADDVETEADTKRRAVQSMRRQAEALLRSLVSKEENEQAEQRMNALMDERTRIFNARNQDGARGIPPDPVIRAREDARLEQIAAEIGRLADLWRTA